MAPDVNNRKPNNCVTNDKLHLLKILLSTTFCTSLPKPAQLCFGV